MNRKTLNEILSDGISDELKSELDYYLGIDRDEDSYYDLSDAFDDYLNIILSGNPTKEMQAILIKVGYAVETDITKVIVSRGKKYWFKHKGKHYDCVASWEAWISN